MLPSFDWVLPSFTRFYRVLPSFTGFYRVIPSLTRFYRVFTGFYRVGGAEKIDWIWLAGESFLLPLHRIRLSFSLFVPFLSGRPFIFHSIFFHFLFSSPISRTTVAPSGRNASPLPPPFRLSIHPPPPPLPSIPSASAAASSALRLICILFTSFA